LTNIKKKNKAKQGGKFILVLGLLLWCLQS